MKNDEIIKILSEKNNYSKTLLEKDLLLHEVLLILSKNKDFKEKYAFKG